MGKLGFPCALAAAQVHDVVGFDLSPHFTEILASRVYPHQEAGVDALLKRTRLRSTDSIAGVVEHADIVFVAIQTPHEPQYDGTTRLPPTRADFDYTALKAGVGAIAAEALRQEKSITLAVISTVLPGTCRRELLPLLNPFVAFVYNPFFIAMGTTIHDYLHPEFVLLGGDSRQMNALIRFYEPLLLPDTNFRPMQIESAELTKMLYNTFIGMKIVLANTAMELAHELGGDCDEVMEALMLAKDRLVSTKYMRAGMGDGGNCHPRDQIALSWLYRNTLALQWADGDFFGSLMLKREQQSAWLAHLTLARAASAGMGIVVLGRAYKANLNLDGGSAATLLYNILSEICPLDLPVLQYDPHIPGFDDVRMLEDANVFVLATPHGDFVEMQLPKGSVVIDPWGVRQNQPGVTVVRPGRMRT
jgi:UDPglucose 6-dehydrogenase